MASAKQITARFTDDEIRQIILRFFFDRNCNATSMRGKQSGAAVSISVLRSELKASHGLTRQQVVSNLTYLLSQGWVEEKPVAKSFATPRGSIVPSVTMYYIITAAGIDKIGGPSEFMRDRFEGIRVQATGQNIITIGDGNQIEAGFKDVGEALADLADAIKASEELDDSAKLDLVADINSMQDQLAKKKPNNGVLRSLWAGVETAAKAAGIVEAVTKVAGLIGSVLSQLFPEQRGHSSFG
jgi:hypothetical protein